nr:uncharacterized protein LOC116429571 [Nomia melanderi]
MESPSAQDRLLEAQEDFSSLESPGTVSAPSTTAESTATTETTLQEATGTTLCTKIVNEAGSTTDLGDISLSESNGNVGIGAGSHTSPSCEDTATNSSWEIGAEDVEAMGLKLGKCSSKGAEKNDAGEPAATVVEAVKPSNDDELPAEQQGDCVEATPPAAVKCPDQDEDLRVSGGGVGASDGADDDTDGNADGNADGDADGDVDDSVLAIGSPTSRKRPATDFLPINAEIKRIGVEVAENEGNNQLRSDVRRISPVLVSLRERTLGEISLSSDSCLFDDDVSARCMSRSGRIHESPLSTAGCRLNASFDSSPQISRDSETIVTGESRVYGLSPADGDPDNNVEDVSDCTRKLDFADSFIDEDSCCSLPGESPERDHRPCQEKQCEEPIETCPCKTASADATSCHADQMKGPYPYLVVMLERIDYSTVASATDRTEKKRPDNNNKKKQRNAGESNVPDINVESDSPVNEMCYVQRYTPPKKIVPKTDLELAKKQFTSPMVTRSKTPTIELSSPSLIDKKSCQVRLEKLVWPKLIRTSEKSVKDEITVGSAKKKVTKDEEIASPSLLLSTESLQPSSSNRNSIDARPNSPEEPLEPPTDAPEAVDTETETETGSDSSEVSSMTSVPLRGCDDDAVSDQVSCPESESMCCVDINPEIITRLEAERPEAFTEDSAESLALATGARDEVRSDGSDSGLGSEIPGDPGPAPAPESDSETSFLDRIPDDILSDKEKAVNQLDSFVPNVVVPGTPQAPLTTFPSPPKSNLKRRLTDCMEGAPNPKRSNTDEPMKKKRNIHFDAVTVYYFPRAQGFTCVPSQGGSTLGMSATHTHAERFSLSEHAAEQRRIHRARLAQLRSERAANCVVEAASSSEDPSDDTDEEQSDNEELDIDSYYFLQPVPTWQRRALLRAAGVRRIDAVEKDECRDIRASREHCGCGCKGYCDPESCPCSRANVKCQVDRAGFPCGCTRDGCANISGRIEFNPVRVRTHFIHTLMRLELEKKQREEEEEGTDHDASDNQNGRSPLREINLGSVMENRNAAESCLSGGGFTTLHYENHDAGDGGTSCQPDVPGTREDSLDLYAIRDDCYPSEDTVDGTQGPQRKLHPEFSQAFQTFSGQTGAGVNFQQPAYQDYQPYANLPSTSRVQFQPHFQAVPGNSGFSHYAPYGQDAGTIPGNCQVHPGQHTSAAAAYEATFAQDETTGSQYTNLSSVQPAHNAVQQMGKLEPFSELLSGRYSYYGEMEPQAHGTYHANGTKVEAEKGQGNEQQSESTEECDENFGEIIKKSMVETVSA